jgi:hypothetical protein
MKPDIERIHQKQQYAIEDRQLEEIECCLGNIETYCSSLVPWVKTPKNLNTIDHPYEQTIYMFIREYPLPVRLYLGESFQGKERIENQIKYRKWATHVISLHFTGYLYPRTLRLIETSLLRNCPKFFVGALWHNEMSVNIRSKDPLLQMGPYPVLDALVSEIIEIFSEWLPKAAFVPYPENKLTHIIGDPSGDFYGLLSQRGKRTILLKGSRISARAPNLKALRNIGGSGINYGYSLDYLGKMERKQETKKRPAGFVITEDCKFPSMEEAAKFLTLDSLCSSSSWKKITSNKLF